MRGSRSRSRPTQDLRTRSRRSSPIVIFTTQSGNRRPTSTMTWHLRKAQRTRCAPIFFFVFVFVLLPFWGGPTHFREGPCLPDGYLNTNYNKQRAIRLLQPLQPTLGAKKIEDGGGGGISNPFRGSTELGVGWRVPAVQPWAHTTERTASCELDKPHESHDTIHVIAAPRHLTKISTLPNRRELLTRRWIAADPS